MHDELTNLAREMLKNGSAAVLADFLENQDNDDADVVRALGTPDEVVRYLLPRYLPPTFVYECDFFSDHEQLEFILLKSTLEQKFLFEVGCDFASDILSHYEQWNPHDRRPHQTLEAMRKWIAGMISNDELTMIRCEMRRPKPTTAISRAVVRIVYSASNPDSWAAHLVASRCAYDTAIESQRIFGEEQLARQLAIVKKKLLSEFNINQT